MVRLTGVLKKHTVAKIRVKKPFLEALEKHLFAGDENISPQ